MSSEAPRVISDAAKMISDKYNTHRLAMGLAAIGQWFVVRLADGTSPDADTLYASKEAAVYHMGARSYEMAYVRIKPSSMSWQEAQAFLNYARKLHRNGWRMPDPDSPHGGPDLIRRLTREEDHAQFRALFRSR
jgi:hypothetical protein